jgi:sodium transport system permease protein
MNGALIIFLKDLRESLRNRRTVLRMLLLPGLLLPLGGHYFLAAVETHRENLNKAVLDYAVAGGQNLPDLVKMYEADTGLHRVSVPEDKVEQAVKDKQVKFALRIPKDAGEKLKAGQSVSIEFIYYQADPGEIAIKDRGTAPLEAYSVRQRDWRLLFLGVARESARESLLHPVTYAALNTASDRDRIGFLLGAIVAYTFLLACSMGCSFVAADLVAGEKEKGTLEILVMLPVPRLQIVLGKYFVIFASGLVYATVNAISICAWMVFETRGGSSTLREVISQITPGEILLLWATLIPVTALFAAIVLGISVYSRSYREAAGLASFASVCQSMLVMVVFASGISLGRVWSFVPISNLGLMIRELVRGRLEDYLAVTPVFGITIALGAGLLLLATAGFRREAIIYRD